MTEKEITYSIHVSLTEEELKAALYWGGSNDISEYGETIRKIIRGCIAILPLSINLLENISVAHTYDDQNLLSAAMKLRSEIDIYLKNKHKAANW